MNYYIPLLSLFFLAGCAPNQPPWALVYTEGCYYEQPVLHRSYAKGFGELGDTVLILDTRTAQRTGSGREKTSFIWYKIREPQVTGEVFWIPAYRLALPGDERYAVAKHRDTLPPSPKLYHHQDYVGHPNLWERLRRGSEALGRRMGNDYEIELELLTKAVDHADASLRTEAVSHTAGQDGPPHLVQVISIHDHLSKNWNFYAGTFGVETFQPASKTIDQGYTGDDGDYAVVMAGLLASIGFEVMLNRAFGPLGSRVYVEVHLGDQATGDNVREYLKLYYNVSETPGIRVDEQGRTWLNLDSNDPFVGGRYFEAERLVQYDVFRHALRHVDLSVP